MAVVEQVASGQVPNAALESDQGLKAHEEAPQLTSPEASRKANTILSKHII